MIDKILNMSDVNEQRNIAVDLIYLVSCALHSSTPQKELVKQMNLSGLFKLSQFHLLLAITYMALDIAKAFDDYEDREMVNQWRELKDKAIRKNILLDIERQKICSYMEQEGIWYMPLKGVILKELYPKVGMRQMADNDILFDSQYQHEVKEVMKKCDFKVVSIGKGNHDIYEKQPIYNFEMHTSLYGKGHDETWVAYYNNVKERLILDENKPFEYHFSDEDFYVYIITHAYKHYKGSGTGIRSLVDIYVFLLKKEASLNWNYILGELKKLHVEDFERDSRELAKKLFSRKQCSLTAQEELMLSYFLGSGTYGTIKNSVENKMHEYQVAGEPFSAATKKKYFMKRLFPDEKYYRDFVPFAYKHKWFRPVYMFVRIIRGMFRNGKNIVKEVKTVMKIDK